MVVSSFAGDSAVMGGVSLRAEFVRARLPRLEDNFAKATSSSLWERAPLSGRARRKDIVSGF